MQRTVVRLAVAALIAAAAGLGVATPAQASTCPTAHGVTVVVDFNQLGGGAQSRCDASGAGRTATTQLTDVGYRLTYVQRQPGFVCRIDGKPTSDPCVNTPPSDAYWSLWWSDGKSGTWTYSSSGAASLKVPDGGYVGMSWQGGSAQAPPGVAPKSHPSASPSPTQHPTRHPSQHPSSAPTHSASNAPSSAPSDAPSTAASSSTSTPATAGSHGHTQGPGKKKKAQATGGARPSPADSPSAGDQAAPSLDPAAVPASASGTGSDGGLPGWVAPVVVLLLFAAAGTVVVVRRRGHGGT